VDAKAFEQIISIVPTTLIATIVCGLCTFIYKTLKHLAERTYEEMIEHNEKINKRLDSIEQKQSMTERDSHETKIQLNNYVPAEKHYNSTRSIDRDMQELRERVARIEGREKL